jgi:hypothetical protein
MTCNFRRAVIRPSILLFLALVPASLNAQAPAAAKTPDTIVFVNGEQLTGELEKANGAGITFKSTMAGEITIPWAKIKTLNSSKSFAILTSKLKVTKKTAPQVPQGAITADAKTITVTGTTESKSIPVAEANQLLDSTAFNQAVNHEPKFSQGWAGAATGDLTKSSPTVDWLPPRDRSSVGYTQSYGTTSQSGTPTVKTDIWQASLERDQFFTPRLFASGTATFNHSFAQTLQLQEAYGVGVGMTVIKNSRREFDVKGNIEYTRESFFVTTQNVNLIGSMFSESWVEHLTRQGLVFNEFASLTPSYNIPSDYSLHVNTNLIFPVYKGFGFNVGFVDDFLNNAPAGSNKNSTQFTTGISYVIKPR